MPRPTPHRIALTDAGWPLHDSAASRAVERESQRGLPPHTLMQRAGDAVARLALAVAPHARRIEVLVGPGNNGGDGLVAATALHRHGVPVLARLAADPARFPADAAWAFERATQAAVPIAAFESAVTPEAPDLLIDALLGLGTTRAPEGRLAEAVARANSAGCAVLAVDLPSGLNADTGQPLDMAVRADHTLALLTLKPGLFTAQGRDLAGVAWFDDLAVASAAEPASARLPGRDALRAAFPQRAHASHKGSYGDVVVVGGAAGMVGAVWLAAEAAAAAGAGRVYVSALCPGDPAALPRRAELMTRRDGWREAPAVLAAATVVAGCGGGTEIAAALPPLLAHAGALVLDADALNAVAADPALRRALAARVARGRGTVLTPHPLEAARLLQCDAAQVQRDRLHAARELARLAQAHVVLKGSGTVIAPPDGAPLINPTGNALLASPGTGDVLAGWIGGTWSPLNARGVDGALAASLAAVWLHGHAADLALGAGHCGPLLAGDLAAAMQRARQAFSAARAGVAPP